MQKKNPDMIDFSTLSIIGPGRAGTAFSMKGLIFVIFSFHLISLAKTYFQEGFVNVH